MYKYNKYIFAQIAGPMFLISISLTGIAWLTQSLKLIDYIVNRGLDIKTFLYLSSLLLPSLLWIVIPVSLFISIVLAYSRLSSDSEIIILRNAGLDRLSIMKPAILFALLVTMFSYLIAAYLLPASYREFKDTQTFIRDNYASLLLQEGVFASPTNGLTVYIRQRDSKGRLKGLIVHDNRKPDKAITYMAEEGKPIKSASGPSFLLINGNIQEINKETNDLSLLYFERYALELSIFNTDINKNRWREPQERYIHELFNPTDTTDQKLINKLAIEGHHRITWPLFNLVLAFLALMPFVRGQYSRGGQSGKIIISISAALVVSAVSIIMNNAMTASFHLSNGVYIIYAYIFISLFFILYILLGSRETKDRIIDYKNKMLGSKK